MWNADKNFQAKGFSTPPPTWKSKKSFPVMPCSERKKRNSPQSEESDLFHVIHKVPAGDSPYVRAKHVQVRDLNFLSLQNWVYFTIGYSLLVFLIGVFVNSNWVYFRYWYSLLVVLSGGFDSNPVVMLGYRCLFPGKIRFSLF